MLRKQGPVRFYNNERKASFELKQFQHGDCVKIGEFNSLYDHLDLSLGSPVKWVSIYRVQQHVIIKFYKRNLIITFNQSSLIFYHYF